MIRRLSYALAGGLIMALTGARCIGVQSDPLPGGSFVSRLVIIPRDGQPLGDVTPFATPTPDHLPTPTPTPAPCLGTVTAETSLNVRSGPGVSYAWVGSLRRGATVEIVGSSGEWLQIANPAGWVAGKFVRVGMCDEVP